MLTLTDFYMRLQGRALHAQKYTKSLSKRKKSPVCNDFAKQVSFQNTRKATREANTRTFSLSYLSKKAIIFRFYPYARLRMLPQPLRA